MGYDKGCLMGEIGFWVDFVRGLGDLERLVFRVGVWTNQLIVIPGNIRLLLVFATPYTLKTTVFLYFTVGLIIEKTFNRIRARLLERNKLEHMFGL